MKYLDEFRNAGRNPLLGEGHQARIVTQPWTVMEVCGGQTHAIVKHTDLTNCYRIKSHWCTVQVVRCA